MSGFEQAREFVAVVEAGSFTAAARELGVSTAFVSRRVKQLESSLNAKLLQRSTRVVSLTEMGRVYYERSREVLDQWEQLHDDMADLNQQPRGLIRVTAAGFYADRFVAPVLAKFCLLYPEISVELDTPMRIVDIVAEGYDIAVRMSTLADSSMVARRVCRRRLMVCGSADYFRQYGTPQKPEDLRQHNCLRLKGMAWKFRSSDQERAVSVRGRFKSDDGRALVAAALEGVGLIRLSEYYVAELIEQGRLQVVLEDYEVQDAATWLIYPDRQRQPARVRLLIDHLLQNLQ